MKISIITPSYNQGNFIEDAIQSVLAQNYPNIEHIVIDAASTDNTVDILRKYPHVKWISEKDKGQSDALNKGFKMATGDVIGWLNCDDFYLPGAFEKITKELSNPKVDGVYSDLQFCNEKKEIVDYYQSNRPNKLLSLFITYICSETFFFRRKVLENNHQVEVDFNNCMDQEFIAKLLYHNYKLKYAKACFATFRWQGTNKSMMTPETKKRTMKEGLIIFNKYNGFLKFNPDNSINQQLYEYAKYIFKIYRYFLKYTS
jgi:glycosyltransferase involved in cell wall biosynthesis